MKPAMRPINATRPSPSGFTLTELLVVILIVAVLAVLGFMGLTRAREQAISAADTAKFRQVGAAIASIAQDNNNIIPHNNVNKPGFGIPNTATSENGPNRYNFHEAVDRFFPPPPKFNPVSIYNYETREGSESIYTSKAAKPWPGYKPSANRKLDGPLWFSYQSNLNHGNWAGNLTLVPDPSRIVLCTETNHMGGEMRPRDKAVFEADRETRYRVSRAGRTALYLFVDGHVEKLQGERGEAYYAANRNETNIWKWW